MIDRNIIIIVVTTNIARPVRCENPTVARIIIDRAYLLVFLSLSLTQERVREATGFLCGVRFFEGYVSQVRCIFMIHNNTKTMGEMIR